MKDKFNRWFIPGFMLVSSVTLIVIGVPRFLHELMLVPGTPILHQVNAGEAVSEEELKILEKSRLDALGIIELPDAYLNLGASYLYRARTATDPVEAQKYAALTIEVSEKGLKMAPLNTYAWFRVATANVMLGNYQEGLDAWRTSIATARFEPFLLLQSFHLGTILYQDMADEDVELLKDQIRMAYRWNKQYLRKYVRDNNLVVWMAILCEPESEIKKYLTN